MRFLPLLLLIPSLLLLSAQATNADAMGKIENILPEREFGRAILPNNKPFVVSPADKAMSLYQQGDYRGAIHAYDKLLHEDPANQEALRYRGLAHMGLGQYKKGQQDFLSCSSDRDTESSHPGTLGADPNEIAAQALYEQGCLALGNHEYDYASLHFKWALDQFPRDNADSNDAITESYVALSYQPLDFRVWECLSFFCWKRGFARQSVGAANIALSLNPPESDQTTLNYLITNGLGVIQIQKMQWPSKDNVDPFEAP